MKLFRSVAGVMFLRSWTGRCSQTVVMMWWLKIIELGSLRSDHPDFRVIRVADGRLIGGSNLVCQSEVRRGLLIARAHIKPHGQRNEAIHIQ